MGDIALPPEEERQFRGWVKGLDWYKEYVQEYGEHPNLNDPNFNYRTAYSHGVTPARSEFDYSDKLGKYRFHWPDALPGGTMLKTETHPSAWMNKFMGDYGFDPGELGLLGNKPPQPVLFRMIGDYLRAKNVKR